MRVLARYRAGYAFESIYQKHVAQIKEVLGVHSTEAALVYRPTPVFSHETAVTS